MLLDSFGRELDLARALTESPIYAKLDPEDLGKSARDSFFFELKQAIIGPKGGKNTKVKIPKVGTFIRKGENIEFNPLMSLKKHTESKKFLLKKFLEEKIGTANSSFLFGNNNWANFFEPQINSACCNNPLPYSAHRNLAILGADILAVLIKKDPKLYNPPLAMLEEALCLFIHDAIVSGQGIEIESIGTITNLN